MRISTIKTFPADTDLEQVDSQAEEWYTRLRSNALAVILRELGYQQGLTTDMIARIYRIGETALDCRYVMDYDQPAEIELAKVRVDTWMDEERSVWIFELILESEHLTKTDAFFYL